MRNDITDLKKLTLELMESGSGVQVKESNQRLIQKIYGDKRVPVSFINCKF